MMEMTGRHCWELGDENAFCSYFPFFEKERRETTQCNNNIAVRAGRAEEGSERAARLVTYLLVTYCSRSTYSYSLCKVMRRQEHSQLPTMLY